MLQAIKNYDTKNKILMVAGVLAIALCLCGGTFLEQQQIEQQAQAREEQVQMTLAQLADADLEETTRETTNQQIKAEKAEQERLQKEEEERKAKEEAERQAYYATYSTPSYSYSNTGGLTKSGGVYYYNGRRETWYSSRTLYHYRTSEWTVDGEGFYRDSQGRYVVASNQYPNGTEITTSKGKAVVEDKGCDGVDFYVNF